NVWLGDTQPSAKTTCPIIPGIWYTFNITISGSFASGWASAPGQTRCSVSGAFPASSPAASGTRFGLYAGGYSALFERTVATTVSPAITTTRFSNSFIQNGAPSARIHLALAGTAGLTNGTGTSAMETYNSYYSWGALNQQTIRYDPRSTQGTPNPLAIDGSAVAACSNTTSSCSVSLTTARSNDVIIVYASEALDLQTTCSFSVYDTAGLTWMPRGRGINGNGIRDQLQEFWAISPSTLSSDAVTERIVSCGNNYNSLQVFGVSGADTNNPFDQITGLPAAASGN